MQKREITVKEVEEALNEYDKIEEPIVVKRQNKSDVVIISLEEYKEKIMKMEIIKHLQKSEQNIKDGKTIPAEEVFRELREEYGE